MRQYKSFGLGLVYCAVVFSASAQELHVMDNAIQVFPKRAMAVRFESDGSVTSLGPWVELGSAGENGAAPVGSASNLNLFDAFENGGEDCGRGYPDGGNACGLAGPASRYSRGPTFCDQYSTGEMDAELEVIAERVQIAWAWYCNGSGSEDCYVAIYTSNNFGTPCNVDYARGDGVVYHMGVLPCNPGPPEGNYYIADADLRDTGLGHQMYLDGAVSGILAKAFDGHVLTHATCAQFMLWGENAGTGDLAGEHGRYQYEDFLRDGNHEPAECVDRGGGGCPNPLHWMVGFGMCPGPSNCPSDGCNGNERLSARWRQKNCGCSLKLILKGCTVNAEYGVLTPTGECMRRVAGNSRGKIVVKECPSTSGTATVPECGLSVNVQCP